MTRTSRGIVFVDNEGYTADDIRIMLHRLKLIEEYIDALECEDWVDTAEDPETFYCVNMEQACQVNCKCHMDIKDKVMQLLQAKVTPEKRGDSEWIRCPNCDEELEVSHSIVEECRTCKKHREGIYKMGEVVEILTMPPNERWVKGTIVDFCYEKGECIYKVERHDGTGTTCRGYKIGQENPPIRRPQGQNDGE